MKKAPIPKNEKDRLEAVKKLNILDTKPDQRFDRLTKRAVEELKVPISTISIIDKDREWFKSCQGVDNPEGPRSESFCGHAMLATEILIIEDTLKDSRFADNPQVLADPGIRFYAGIALHEKESRLPIGVFCIKDYKPRQLEPFEIALLMQLAKEAEREINQPFDVRPKNK